MRKQLLTTLMSAILCVIASAQVIDAGKFFAGGANDAEELFKGYFSPYFNAFGTSLTGGWYNTAKPHHLGGFDITVTFNTAIVPTSDRTFDIAELTLESLELATGTDNITPTIAGENNTGSQLAYNYPTGSTDEIDAFEMPKGTGFPYIPSPMLQLGVGLIKDTEIMGRYMPTYSTGETKMGMWGIGFKHGLKQWIPFIKKVPVLHLSVQYGYTKMNAEIGLNVKPSDINAIDQTTSANWDNQKMGFVTHSHTGNILISADLPIVCFYGGIGFANTKNNLKLVGDFPSIDFNESLSFGGPVVTDDINSALNNPIDVDVQNSDGSKTKPRYNVGMRFKFSVVTIHGDYTYADYSLVSFGLGINFR